MKNIYLTWDSFKHGFSVTINALEMLWEKENIEISEIIYLMNQDLKPETIAQIKEFEKTRHDFPKPKLTQKRLHTENPTHYQSIYNEVRKYILSLGDFSGKQLHINVSPGTPQMHTVWLMLNSSGYLPKDTILWSSQINQEGKTSLEKIKFKPYDYLHEVFDTSFQQDKIIINPNETLSSKRKETENKLHLFAAIPNAPILILGERGVGKTTYVQEYIHKEYYKDKPIHCLACGMFSEELMRSELFGYKKGAFTGALTDKNGLLDSFKQDGILFLDEIQDLSKPLQRQLMQVLQEKKYYAIGSDTPTHVNFRLITASNLPITQLLSNKKLDRDFFDRIATYIVEVPPLRECKEDLARFWEDTWKQNTKSDLIWDKTLHNFLQNQSLNGNFRDLQKLAFYVIAFFHESKKNDVAIKKAIEEFQKWNIMPTENTESQYFEPEKTHKEMQTKFHYELVKWALAHYGSRKEAALKLGISQAAFSNYWNKK